MDCTIIVGPCSAKPRVFTNTNSLFFILRTQFIVFHFSTVSSGINAVGALILQDFILPRRPTLTDKAQILISKAIGKFLLLKAFSFAICTIFWPNEFQQYGKNLCQLKTLPCSTAMHHCTHVCPVMGVGKVGRGQAHLVLKFNIFLLNI